jgi:hypothetical protein
MGAPVLELGVEVDKPTVGVCADRRGELGERGAVRELESALAASRLLDDAAGFLDSRLFSAERRALADPVGGASASVCSACSSRVCAATVCSAAWRNLSRNSLASSMSDATSAGRPIAGTWSTSTRGAGIVNAHRACRRG